VRSHPAARRPGLRVLVTSQEALHRAEEQVYRLGSLPIGTPEEPAAAIELFVARARSADPRLQLSTGSLAIVAEICRRLDGIPLAIELAAARTRLLGIEGLHARLDERFHVLTGGTRAVLRRHQTLRAALEWSYGLLTADEQTVFGRLGVFVGGFTLELAQGVAADAKIDRWAVLDLLGHLVDKSLVIAEGDERPRYRLLETVRVLALEKLAEAGETPALLQRHAERCSRFCDPSTTTDGPVGIADQIRLGAEIDNLRTALDWLDSAAGDRTLAWALLGSSGGIWLVHSLTDEGIRRALRVLPLPAGVAPEIEARLNLLPGMLGYAGARRECFLAALRAADLYRSLGNSVRLIDALTFAAQIGSRLGETGRVAAAIAEAEALIGPDAPPRQAAALAVAIAVNHQYLGQDREALESSLRQAAFYREGGHEWGVELAMINCAFHECGLDRFDAAIARLHSAIEALRRIGAPYGVSHALHILVCAYAMRGDYDEALANARAIVPHLHRGADPAGLLLSIALVHARHGAEGRRRHPPELRRARVRPRRPDLLSDAGSRPRRDPVAHPGRVGAGGARPPDGGGRRDERGTGACGRSRHVAAGTENGRFRQRILSGGPGIAGPGHLRSDRGTACPRGRTLPSRGALQVARTELSPIAIAPSSFATRIHSSAYTRRPVPAQTTKSTKISRHSHAGRPVAGVAMSMACVPW
jgi:predicted ATPase